MRVIRTFCGTVLWLIVAAQMALGCSLRPLELKNVTPDLTVSVKHQGKPIPGVTVQVLPEGMTDSIFTALTNEVGVVKLRGLLPGKYYVLATHQGIEAGKEWIEVTKNPTAATKSRFEFEWAGWSYQTHHIAGTLSGLVPGDTGNKLQDLLHPKSTLYAGVALTLRNAFENIEFRTVSDSAGQFAFDNIPDGIYILHIAGNMKSIAGVADETLLVIDLGQKETRDSLPLQLKDTGCYRVEFAMNEKA